VARDVHQLRSHTDEFNEKSRCAYCRRNPKKDLQRIEAINDVVKKRTASFKRTRWLQTGLTFVSDRVIVMTLLFFDDVIDSLNSLQILFFGLRRQ